MSLWQGLANISPVATLIGISEQRRTNQQNVDLQRESNFVSSREAEINRDWQEQMSNSAYQRAVDDLGKAGLNPMLAYTQGGASSPGGGQGSSQAAVVENEIQESVATAMAMKRLKEEVGKIQSEKELNQESKRTQKKLQKLHETNARSVEADIPRKKTTSDFFEILAPLINNTGTGFKEMKKWKDHIKQKVDESDTKGKNRWNLHMP